MKLKYYLIVFFSLLLWACSENNPRTVAKKFLSASALMDYSTAKKYATPATAKLLDMLAAAADLTPDSVKKRRETSFEIIKEYSRNDTLAIVLYHLKNSDTDQTLNVVNRDGKWLVNISKDEFNSRELELPAEEEELEPDTLSSSLNTH